MDSNQWDQQVEYAVKLAESLGDYQNLNKVLMGEGIKSVRKELGVIGLEEDVISAVCDGLRDVGMHEDRMFHGVLTGPTPIASLGALIYVINSLIKDGDFQHSDFFLLYFYFNAVAELPSRDRKVRGSENYSPDPRYTNFNLLLNTAITEFQTHLIKTYQLRGQEFPVNLRFRFLDVLREFCERANITYSNALRVQDNLNRGITHILTMYQNPFSAIVENDGRIFIELYALIENYLIQGSTDLRQELTLDFFRRRIEDMLLNDINNYINFICSNENPKAGEAQREIIDQIGAMELVGESSLKVMRYLLESGSLVAASDPGFRKLAVSWYINHNQNVKTLTELIRNVCYKRATFALRNFPHGRFMGWWEMPEI